MRQLRNLAGALFFSALAASGIDAGSASAQQQQWSSQYLQWTSDHLVTDIYNIDQVVWLPSPNNNSWGPMQWTFNGGGSGGYTGLQQGDDTQTQTARFSIWNATRARGLNCQPFGGEGVGQTCTIPVKIDSSKLYRLRLWRVKGNWWGAWLITTDVTGALVEHRIGTILAPTAASPDPASVTNFVEYFGPAVAQCKDVPLSITGFTPPTLNYQGGGIYQGHYTYAGSTKAPGNVCSDGTETVGAFISAKRHNFGFANGVMTFLGATPDKHRLSPTKHPTPPALPAQ